MKALTKQHIRDGLLNDIQDLKASRMYFKDKSDTHPEYKETVKLIDSKIRKRVDELYELIRK